MNYLRFLRITALVLLTSFFLSPIVVWSEELQPLKSFALEPIGEAEPFDSSGYPDTIIVLDFFAPWCVSCVGVTRTVDEEIKDYYAEKSEGRPVIVLAINIDQRKPHLTKRFLERAGLEAAFDDKEGALFDRLSGEGVPLIVVLGPENKKQMREVYFHQMGLDDTSGLKEAIEDLRERSSSPERSDGNAVEENALPMPSVSTSSISIRLDNASEYMAADDVGLFANNFQCEIQSGPLRLTHALSLGWIGMDFEPSSRAFLSEEKKLEEGNWTYSMTTAWVGQQNTLSLTGGYGEGFQDYRSVWLAEYYRQGFEADPVYSEAEPRAAFVSAELASLFYHDQLRLSADVGYRDDVVSPPYERIIPTNPGQPIFTEVGLEELQTLSFGLESDWIFSERTRIQTRVSVDDTTGRELRWAGKLTINQAIADDWVASLTTTQVSEGSDFSAWSVSGAVDYDIFASWFIGATLRYYEDNGLVLDPSVVSADSPPLDSWQVGLRLARVFERGSFSLALLHYQSMYEALGPNSFEFENLYRDRRWMQVRFACSMSF